MYYEEGQEPTMEDIEASEVLEGRLREGFVRLRQLLVRPRRSRQGIIEVAKLV